MNLLKVRRAPISSLADIELARDDIPVHAVRLSMADGKEAPAHLDTLVWCVWADEAIYVVFRACFRQLRLLPDTPSNQPSKTPGLWERCDVLELFLGSEARSSREYGEFQVAPDGSWLDTRVSLRGAGLHLDMSWDSGVQAASFIDREKRIWRSAMRIPWRSLCTDDPGKHRWEGNCYRASGRFHGEELLAWEPTGYGEGCFHRPDRFGQFQLE